VSELQTAVTRGHSRALPDVPGGSHGRSPFGFAKRLRTAFDPFSRTGGHSGGLSLHAPGVPNHPTKPFKQPTSAAVCAQTAGRDEGEACAPPPLRDLVDRRSRSIEEHEESTRLEQGPELDASDGDERIRARRTRGGGFDRGVGHSRERGQRSWLWKRTESDPLDHDVLDLILNRLRRRK
jgi:hypothetical protein